MRVVGHPKEKIMSNQHKDESSNNSSNQPENLKAVAVSALIGTLAKGVFRAAVAAGKKIPWDKAVEEASEQARNLLNKAASSVQAESVKVVIKMENNTESQLIVLPAASYCSSGGMVISADDLKPNEFDYYSCSKNFGTAGACGWTVYAMEPDGYEILVGWMHSYFPNKNPPFVSCGLGRKGQFTDLSKEEIQKRFIGIAPRRHPNSLEGHEWGYTGAEVSVTNKLADDNWNRYQIRAFFSKDESRFELEKIESMFDLSGLTLEEAEKKISLANLVLGEVNHLKGSQGQDTVVIKQEPTPGKGISDGGPVNIWLDTASN
jgi:hypothetical protein